MSNSIKDRINKVKTDSPSKWNQNAAYRLENKWLSYSSQIARRILAIIKDNKDLNQSKLAEILNVTPQQITKIIKGKENLTLETIYKLSQALDFELITFPNYKYNSPILGTALPSAKGKVISFEEYPNDRNVIYSMPIPIAK